MPLLLLIRHGENDFTKKHKLAGYTPNVHLNERGQSQAQALAEALKDVPIKAIYSSPLERAVETATPIAAARGLEIQMEAGLLETNVGKWQGRSLAALRLLPGRSFLMVKHSMNAKRASSPRLTRFQGGTNHRISSPASFMRIPSSWLSLITLVCPSITSND